MQTLTLVQSGRGWYHQCRFALVASSFPSASNPWQPLGSFQLSNLVFTECYISGSISSTRFKSLEVHLGCWYIRRRFLKTVFYSLTVLYMYVIYLDSFYSRLSSPTTPGCLPTCPLSPSYPLILFSLFLPPFLFCNPASPVNAACWDVKC